MSNVIAPAIAPSIMRKPNRTQPIQPVAPLRPPQPSTPMISPPIPPIMRPMKPPMPAPVVMPSAGLNGQNGHAHTTHTPTQPIHVLPPAPTPQSIPSALPSLPATQIPPKEVSSPQMLQSLSQILADQVRIQFNDLQKKLEAKIESCVRNELGTGLRDLKMQYEATEMKGETLNANTPLLSRPDPEAKVEYVFEKVGTSLSIYHPIVSNVHGSWGMTRIVTSNGSMVMGYVPIFTKKLKSVTYTSLDDTEWERRVKAWNPFLDKASDKEFIPHIGRFTI
jgi:hypothetical protein